MERVIEESEAVLKEDVNKLNRLLFEITEFLTSKKGDKINV
ncbi:hypothetical protein C789_4215 [Microcystis aeruginosa FACHB-905 = DIANCHI905]|nr:hypothetical protein C789_4215 [Microcystis aeruginosa FACHB-905 = DIANCHI905]